LRAACPVAPRRIADVWVLNTADDGWSHAEGITSPLAGEARGRAQIPMGAQVRRRVGMSRKPLSSRKTRRAPRRWTFFYRWPGVALPVSDGRFVALKGPTLRDLTAPAQMAQELPDMRWMIAHPNVDLHDGG